MSAKHHKQAYKAWKLIRLAMTELSHVQNAMGCEELVKHNDRLSRAREMLRQATLRLPGPKLRDNPLLAKSNFSELQREAAKSERLRIASSLRGAARALAPQATAESNVAAAIFNAIAAHVENGESIAP